MKFIGQYIQQLIARFRSDVYLESLSDTSETGVLVVDSAGKISKNAGISGGVASTVTVTNSTSNTDFPVVFHNESNGLLDSQNFEYNPTLDTLSVGQVTAGVSVTSPVITSNTNFISNGSFTLNRNDDDSAGFQANVYKLRGASGVGQNSDFIFDLRANSRDGAGNATIYSRFLSKIVSVTDGSEQGDIDLIVMADGTLTSGFLITGQDDGTVDATIGSGANSVTNISGSLSTGIGSTNNLGSGISLPTITDDNVGSFVNFTKSRNNGASSTNDEVGKLNFSAINSIGVPREFGEIISTISNVTNAGELGKLELKVANDGTLRNGITMIGTDTAEEVDVTIGNGAASVATIAGTLTMGSTAFVNNSGVVQVATQGTIDHDSLANFVANEHIDWTGASAGTIHSTNIPTLNQNTTGTAATVTGAAQTSITSLGTLTALNVDNINLDLKRITIVGDTDDTFTITSTTHGETTIETTDTAGASADLNLVADGAITATSTSFTSITDAFNIASATAGKPVLSIVNSNTDTKPPQIILQKTATGGALDGVGTITFKGDDDANNEHTYAGIQSQIVSAANNSEAGKMKLEVATSAGSGTGNKVGILISGSATADNVDVTIGAETTSTTTVTGNLVANRRRFSVTSNTDGSFDGDVVFIGGTTSMITGRIYHYNSSGNWELANPNAAATSDGLLGVALGAASDTNGVFLRGMVTLDHDPGAVGDVLFLNKDQVADTGGTDRYGAATATSPNGNGDIVRIIGYCLDASNGQVWFNPDNTFVEYSVGG